MDEKEEKLKYEEPNENNVKVGDDYIKKCNVRGFSLLSVSEVKKEGVIMNKGITSFYVPYTFLLVKSNEKLLVGKNVDIGLVNLAEEFLI